MKVYRNKIEEFVDMAREEFEIENLRDCSPLVWSGILRYVSNNLITPNRQELFIDNKKNDGKFKRINDGYLLALCDIYIDICLKYDKVITITDYCNMIGIYPETIYSLKDRSDILEPISNYIYIYSDIDYNTVILNKDVVMGYMLTSSPKDIYKRLHSQYEGTLTARLNGGKGNPIGTIAQLNHHFGWNDNNGSNTVKVIVQRSSDEIAQTYGISAGNAPQIESKGGSSGDDMDDMPI